MSQTIFIGLTLFISYCNGFIVPQELPSILSLVYSNIPPIKKGTDSRLGFGFRLGEHADFQVQLELGPQKFTKPIGNSASDDESSDTSKRMVNQDDYHKEIKIQSPSQNAEGTEWLNSWSNNMKSKKKDGIKIDNNDFKESHTESNPMHNLFNNRLPAVQTVPLISQSALSQLQLLYGKPAEINKSPEPDDTFGTLSADNMERHIQLAKELENLEKEKISEELKDVSFD